MPVKEAAILRANLYEGAILGVNEKGFKTEPFKSGVLIDIGDGYFAKMTISICDATKFDIDATREEYAAILETRRLAAEKKAADDAEKARKAAERAEKAKEKADKE